ncbi:hypothetical protein [Adhaeribacter terreus]|uniref:YD repeat-containing protein n=1 Tax=Adhaeribacter terreus TaxID=529703 RepID=A0ABW0EDQ9_9BACT
MKKVNALVLGLAVLLAFSCEKEKKDDPAPETPQPAEATFKGCILTQDSSFSGSYKINYKHNAKGQITELKYFTRTDTTTEQFTYKPDGNIVTFSYSNPQEGAGYLSYQYNANNLISRIDINNQPKGSGQFALDLYMLFTYDSLQRVKQRTSFYPPFTTWSYQDRYTYLPTGNIVVKRYTDGNGIPMLTNTTEYGFDTKKNPTPTQLTLIGDELYTSHNTTYKRSVHHTTNVTNEFFITYQYNADDYPVNRTVVRNNYPTGGNAYKYHCQ